MSDLARHPCLEKNLLQLINAAVQRSSSAPKVHSLCLQIRDLSTFEWNKNAIVTVADSNYFIRAQFSPECWAVLAKHRSMLKDLVGTFVRIKQYSLFIHANTGEIGLQAHVLEFLDGESLRHGSQTNFSKHPQVSFMLQNCARSEFVLEEMKWTPAGFAETAEALLLVEEEESSQSNIPLSLPPTTQVPYSELQCTPSEQPVVHPEDDGLSSAEDVVHAIRADISTALDNASTEDEEEEEPASSSLLAASLPLTALPPAIISHNAQDLTVTLTFTKPLGLSVDADLKVTSLTDAGEAKKLGMRVGDHIESVGGKELFRDVRELLERNSVPIDVKFRRNLVDLRVDHWFGGIVYEGVVLRGGRPGEFQIKYNDGHLVTKRESEVVWLLTGKGAEPHEHDIEGRCIEPSSPVAVAELEEVDLTQQPAFGDEEPVNAVVTSSSSTGEDNVHTPVAIVAETQLVETTTTATELVESSLPSLLDSQSSLKQDVAVVVVESSLAQVNSPAKEARSPVAAITTTTTTTTVGRRRLKRIKTKLDENWCDGFEKYINS